MNLILDVNVLKNAPSYHVLIDIIRNHENVVLLAEVGNFFNFRASENFAQRVVRVVEDDGLCLGVEQRLQLGRVQLPVGGAHNLTLVRFLEKICFEKRNNLNLQVALK